MNREIKRKNLISPAGGPVLPQLLMIAQEHREVPYVSEGRKRRGEDHCIFHWCLAGGGKVREGGRLYDVRPGHGFLCIINEMDYFLPPEGPETSWDLIWFGYRGGVSRQLTRSLIEKYGSPVFPFPEDCGMALRLRSLLERREPVLELDEFAAASLVFDLFSELKRQREKTADRRMPAKLMRLLTDLPRAETVPQVKELAQEIGWSRAHLSRQFSRTTGETLQQHLLTLANNRARHLLSDTALPVGEIARRCGFFNKSSFIRMFRRRNGISPGQYRRMIEAGRN